jgi:hypothetical protein
VGEFARRTGSGERGWPDNSVARGDSGRTGGHRTVEGGQHSAGSGRTAEGPQASAPRQPRLVTAGLVLMGVVVLLAGTVAGVSYFSGSDRSPDSRPSSSAGGKTVDDAAQRTVSAPLGGRKTASFELLAGVNTVHVKMSNLGQDLYRISTPADAGIKPSPVVRDDDVQLQVDRDGTGTGGQIEVVLSTAVRWQLRFSGYAEEQQINLSGGKVSSVEMIAGTHKAELQLPQPSGTVPVKISGSVDQLALRSPADNPVRVKVGGGATDVVAGSRKLHDIASGSTLTPKDWKAHTDRYDVIAASAIGSLNVEIAPQ